MRTRRVRLVRGVGRGVSDQSGARGARLGVHRAQLPRSRQLSAAPARQSAGCRRPFYARNGPRGLHPRHPRCAPAPTPTPQKRGVAPGLSAANDPLCCPVPHQPQVGR